LLDPFDASAATRASRCTADNSLSRSTRPRNSLAFIALSRTNDAGASCHYIKAKQRLVETRPTDKTMVVIGDKAYVSRDEATKQMAILCK
jgi:hypothetical protein